MTKKTTKKASIPAERELEQWKCVGDLAQDVLAEVKRYEKRHEEGAAEDCAMPAWAIEDLVEEGGPNLLKWEEVEQAAVDIAAACDDLSDEDDAVGSIRTVAEEIESIAEEYKNRHRHWAGNVENVHEVAAWANYNLSGPDSGVIMLDEKLVVYGGGFRGVESGDAVELVFGWLRQNDFQVDAFARQELTWVIVCTPTGKSKVNVESVRKVVAEMYAKASKRRIKTDRQEQNDQWARKLEKAALAAGSSPKKVSTRKLSKKKPR